MWVRSRHKDTLVVLNVFKVPETNGCLDHGQPEPGKYLKVGLMIGPASVSFLALLRLSLCVYQF